MKQLIKSLVLFYLCLLTVNKCYSQDSIKCNQAVFNDTLLDKLNGNWMAVGTVASDKVVYSFSNKWVLNHQFLELSFADTAAKPEYSAHVYIGFDCEKHQYIVHWIDNFGGPFSETLGYGTQKGQSIELLFKYPMGTLINTFSYDQQNKQWTSHAVTRDESSNWIAFGHLVLKPLQ